MQQREMQGYVASFQVVTRLIEELRSQLPALSGHEAGDPMIRHLILTHALLDAALIKLHTPFSYGHSVSKQQCLSSARNIVKCGGLNLQEVGYLNPVMGVSLSALCLVAYALHGVYDLILTQILTDGLDERMFHLHRRNLEDQGPLD